MGMLRKAKHAAQCGCQSLGTQGENSRLCALSRAEINQAQHARSKVQSQLEIEIRRVADLESKLAASNSAQQCSTAQDSGKDHELHSLQQQDSLSSRERQSSEVQRLKKALQQHEATASDAAEQLRRDKQLAEDKATASQDHARQASILTSKQCWAAMSGMTPGDPINVQSMPPGRSVNDEIYFLHAGR